jgi:hypothetical protein
MEVAIERAVREKKPVPEIDFTLHTMEDGNTVSTQERVCKGERIFCGHVAVLLLISIRRASTCDATANRSTVLVTTRAFQAKSTVLEAAFLSRRPPY